MERLTHSYSHTVTLNAATGTKTVEMLNMPTILRQRHAELEGGQFYKAVAAFVEAYTITADIDSIGKSPFPAIAPEDTQEEAQAKILEIASKFPKLAIELISYAGGQWHVDGRVLLFNRGTVFYWDTLRPYYTRGQVKPLGQGEVLGLRMKNLGSGVLGGADFVTAKIAWREEYTYVAKPVQRVSGSQSFGVNLAAGVPQIVRAQNPDRRVLWLVNQGSSDVFLSFNGNLGAAALGEGAYLAPRGSLNLENLYWQIDLPVVAIASADCRVSGVEFYG